MCVILQKVPDPCTGLRSAVIADAQDAYHRPDGGNEPHQTM